MGKRTLALRLSLSCVLLVATLIFTGCGGGGAASSSLNALQAGPETVWPVHGYEGAARSGSFAAVAVDASERLIDPLTSALRLEVREDGAGQLVRIVGQRIERRAELFLHLRYDEHSLHPVLTRPGQWMPDDALFLGITNQPGLVAIGISATERGLTSGEEVELAAVRFESGGWQRSRGASAVAKTPVSDLRFDTANPATLVWSYTSPGDYNQDSEVGVADITPIGIHLRKTSASGDWAAAQVTDGDGNGEVNTADLVPIASNYRNTITGYQVKGAASPAGPFVNDALVAFSASAFPLPPGGGYRQLSHTLGTPVNGSWYTVTAVSGSEEAAQASNAAQYSTGGGLNPPQNLSAAQVGLAVRLTWDAPAQGAPDSYNCYYSIEAGMTGATQMNLPGQVTGLNFDCPLAIQPDGSYYFGVKAVYGGEESPYSNIFGYNTGGGLDAPTGLSAAQAGLGVRLTWLAPLDATPDSYNCYYSLGAGMTGAQQMNLPGTITGLSFDCPLAIQSDGSYYFGVKAVYDGQESPFSNIFGYNTGGGLAVPTGLSAAQEGDQIRLTWNAAEGASAYNCYAGTNSSMSNATLMSTPPSPLLQFDCPPGISPDGEHYFAVKALHGGVESGFSNVFHYTSGGGGGDSTPPVWQGGEGIKAATPSSGGTTVFVSWNIAIDADSPPVQYLFYAVADGQDFDWDNPAEIFASTITSTPVTALGDGTPLQDGQRYKFAVKAQDNAAPVPNLTTNENFLYATPQVLPASPAHIPNEVSPIQTTDNASVRINGEEVPRIAGVNRGNNLYYVKWDLSLAPPQWTVYDLNQINTSCPSGRKYHPQLVAVNDTIHLLFATATAVYEFFGDKDDPANWELKTIDTGFVYAPGDENNPGVTGSALVYSENGAYFAAVFAGKKTTDQLWYSDRDTDGEWGAPVSIMAGNPQIWQCDMTIDETTGAQWAVASSGSAGGSGNNLRFWYVRRDSRSAAWGAAVNSGRGSDVMTIDMDYTTNTPVVVSAQVRDVATGFGAQPVSDAAILTWTGNAWTEQVMEQGDCIIDLGSFTIRTILTGQDPQLIFSPAGKAIALWSNLDFFVDIINDEGQLTGDWRYSQRPMATWSNPASLLAHISSSNSVTAGESFQHCVTSDLGQIDLGTADEIANKYGQRNNYVAGPLYFLYRAWN